MPIVFDEISATVVSQPTTAPASSTSGDAAGGDKTAELEEMRRKLTRALRLTSRLEAD